MNTKISKRLVSITATATALLTSATLMFGSTTLTYAASNAKVKNPPANATIAAPVKSSAPVEISMKEFNRRVATLPALASLKDGDMVYLNDDGSITGSIWQGAYVYHPAGSVVQPTAMYARWKDGVVTVSPNISGTLDASFVQRSTEPATAFQTVKTLINDGADLNVLRIPDNAWLFRVDSNGQYIALVDTFVFQSGNRPVALKDVQSDVRPLPAATEYQPVPVAAGTADTN